MNKFWKDMGIALTMGLIVPSVLLAGVVSLATAKPELPVQTDVTIQTGALEVMKPQMEIDVLSQEGQVVRLPLDDYLTAVVLAEMPVSFEDEALKAQSVVARTYTLRAAKGAAKHTEASVCTNSTCWLS